MSCETRRKMLMTRGEIFITWTGSGSVVSKFERLASKLTHEPKCRDVYLLTKSLPVLALLPENDPASY
jgi:hypothetical protein